MRLKKKKVVRRRPTDMLQRLASLEARIERLEAKAKPPPDPQPSQTSYLKLTAAR